MRGTRNLRKTAARLETFPLRDPATITLLYGTLFAIVMIFIFCSCRFPIEPSTVEPPYRGMCGFLTVVNVCFGAYLALDCVRALTRPGRRRILASLSPALGLVLIVCIQLVVEGLRHYRVV